ncbi:crocetin glucosyltransferase protein [Artemisia annua]|uniref:Glycosyltransferase n=1 Tax=Artemisia annua TaxID=35608 RepID=A0A2U1KCX0_ARTAN|nr:crocetin glucosyltransferase protein [Artemisia annua]
MTTVMSQKQPHFFIVTYPAQGHINPAIQFAKRLIPLGVKVTFSTAVSAYRRMSKSGGLPECFNFATFSDGFDDGFDNNKDDLKLFLIQLRTGGTQCIKDTIHSNVENGTPVTCLIYTLLLPWAGEVARGLNVPSALLWIQPASVFRIYYYYFNGYGELIGDDCNEPSWSIQLPGLPLLRSRDLPSFLHPSNPYSFMLDLFKEDIERLNSVDNPIVLVNTVDALEEEALKDIEGKLKLIAVGPLLPSAFLDGINSADKSSGGDLFESSKDYLKWMNSKPEGSIVYISFGSLLVFSKKQKEAMAHGLLESGRPFLWVIRDEKEGEKKGEDQEDNLSFMKELEQLGLIVPWCAQLEVLSHPSLGCFVTHCGWNSTLESIVCGVPVVAFPQWIDQTTNAKLLEDVWETGVRVTANEDGVVEGEEIERCLEMVMGGHEKGATMREKAKKWKNFAREAVKESGSSCMNLKFFVEKVAGSSTQDSVASSSN